MIWLMPLGCPGRDIIMSFAEPTKSKNETPIYRPKCFIFNENRSDMGVRRVHRFWNRGLVNHKRVQRIMNQFALSAANAHESNAPTKAMWVRSLITLSIGISQHREAVSKWDNRCIAIQSAFGVNATFSDS